MSRHSRTKIDEFDIYIGATQLAHSTSNRAEALRLTDSLSLVHRHVRLECNGRTIKVLKRTVGELHANNLKSI